MKEEVNTPELNESEKALESNEMYTSFVNVEGLIDATLKVTIASISNPSLGFEFTCEKGKGAGWLRTTATGALPPYNEIVGQEVAFTFASGGVLRGGTLLTLSIRDKSYTFAGIASGFGVFAYGGVVTLTAK